MRWTMIGSVIACAALLIGVAARLASAPEPPREYPQSTPESALDAVFEMVEQGDAGRLPDLINAESDAMRRALGELALLCNELQEVADAAADLVVAGHNEEVSRRRPKLCLDLHPSTP